MTIVKRLFGLITLLTGGALLVVGLGQKALAPHEPFKLGLLVGGLVWGAISWHFGRKWLFNWIELHVLDVEQEHPAMVAAVQRARDALSVLWRYLEQHRYECYVKFPLETKAGVSEHIWAVVHTRESDRVVVSLANEPVDEPSTREDRRQVLVRDTEDWQVVVSPTEVRGGYTIGALEAIAKERGFSIAPKDRRALRVFVDVWSPALPC